MVPTNDNDWAEILDVVAVESVEEEEEEPDEDEEDAHPHDEEYQLLVAIYPVPSVQRHPVLPPERYILDGDRFPGLLLLPAVVVGVVHVLDGESVAGQAVPRQAAQHRLDGALLGLLQQQQQQHYNSRGLSSVLLLTSLLDSLSSLIFLAMAWWMKLMSDQWRWCC